MQSLPGPGCSRCIGGRQRFVGPGIDLTQAICAALHPGTVDTPRSSRFAKSGLEVQTPQDAAARLLAVIDGLSAKDTGGFFNHHGEPLPW